MTKKIVSLLLCFILAAGIGYATPDRESGMSDAMPSVLYGKDSDGILRAVRTDSSGNLQLGGTLNPTTTNFGGATGVRATAAAGVLTLAGIGNTNNESLLVDLEGTANRALVTTGTGITHIVWQALGGTIPALNAGTTFVLQRNSGVGNDNFFTILAGATSGTSGIFFGDADDEDAGAVRYGHSDDAFNFFSAANSGILQTVASGQTFQIASRGAADADGGNFNIASGAGGSGGAGNHDGGHITLTTGDNAGTGNDGVVEFLMGATNAGVLVADLPTGVTGMFALVSDGADATDCATGAGAVVHFCFYNGSAWTDVT